MRREFIVFLLGIITTWTLSLLLSSYVPTDTDKVLLDTVVGAVGAGNFSYWQLGHYGPLVVELTSITGDADLYVSDGIRPSYEVDKNNFSSVTCGPDIVQIPVDFPRPIGIAVFGHWSSSVSQYSIRVFLDTAAQAQGGNGFLSGYEERKADPEVPTAENEKEYRPRVLRLLNMLSMVFEIITGSL